MLFPMLCLLTSVFDADLWPACKRREGGGGCWKILTNWLQFLVANDDHSPEISFVDREKCGIFSRGGQWWNRWWRFLLYAVCGDCQLCKYIIVRVLGWIRKKFLHDWNLFRKDFKRRDYISLLFVRRQKRLQNYSISFYYLFIYLM